MSKYTLRSIQGTGLYLDYECDNLNRVAQIVFDLSKNSLDMKDIINTLDTIKIFPLSAIEEEALIYNLQELIKEEKEKENHTPICIHCNKKLETLYVINICQTSDIYKYESDSCEFEFVEEDRSELLNTVRVECPHCYSVLNIDILADTSKYIINRGEQNE